MRSNRAVQSASTRRTAILSATTPAAAQVLKADGARSMLAILNKSTAVLNVFMGTLEEYQTGTPVHTVEIAAGGYWEDPANYIGAVTLVWAAANGQANVTEWL